MNFINAFTYAQLAPSILLNSLLIYLILKFSRKHIGTYKYILIIFASCNVILAVVHFVLSPRNVNAGYTFNIVMNIEWGSRFLTSLFCIIFEIPFTLLVIHFVYRYWAVVAPHRLALFTNRYFVGALAFYIVGLAPVFIKLCLILTPDHDTVEIVAARLKFERLTNRTINDGWLSFTYWNNGTIVFESLLFLILIDSVQLLNLTATFTLAILTFRAIRTTAKISASKASSSSQMKMLIAICVQTAIPVVFVYSSYSLNTNLPFFGVNWDEFEHVSMLFTALFPAWDPLVMILLMKPYRDGLVRIIRQRTTRFTTVGQSNEFITGKEQRKFAMKSLHDIGFGSAALEDFVYHYALEAVTRWKKAGDEEVDVSENIMRVIGNIIWNVTFGITLEFDNPIIMEFRRVQQEGIRTAEKTFNPDNEPSSYVEAFLDEQKRREEAGKPIDNFHYEQMLNSAATLWAAGFDTTVSTIRMACLQLVNNPETQMKLQREIDEVVGERVYRVVNVLPFNFRRKTTQATEIEGHSIPLGTTVLPQFSMIHTDPNEFERPDYFCAERHLDEQGHFVEDPRITPFSVGKRACLGESLARMEVFVLSRVESSSTFVQHCSFEPIGKIPPAVELTAGFSRSVKDFRVRIRPRI